MKLGRGQILGRWKHSNCSNGNMPLTQIDLNRRRVIKTSNIPLSILIQPLHKYSGSFSCSSRTVTCWQSDLKLIKKIVCRCSFSNIDSRYSNIHLDPSPLPILSKVKKNYTYILIAVNDTNIIYAIVLTSYRQEIFSNVYVQARSFIYWFYWSHTCFTSSNKRIEFKDRI